MNEFVLRKDQRCGGIQKARAFLLILKRSLIRILLDRSCFPSRMSALVTFPEREFSICAPFAIGMMDVRVQVCMQGFQITLDLLKKNTPLKLMVEPPANDVAEEPPAQVFFMRSNPVGHK